MSKYKRSYNFNIYLTVLLLILFLFFSAAVQAIAKTKDVDWQQVKIESQGILEHNSNDIMANFRYSIALANLGMIEEAYQHMDLISDTISIEDFNKIIAPYITKLKQKPDNILLLNYAAFSSSINSDYRDSIPYFNKIIKIKPQNVSIRNFLAASYLQLEEYDKAKSEVKQALDIKDNKYSHLILGVVYYNTGHFLKAIFEFGQSGDLVKKIMDNNKKNR